MWKVILLLAASVACNDDKPKRANNIEVTQPPTAIVRQAPNVADTPEIQEIARQLAALEVRIGETAKAPEAQATLEELRAEQATLQRKLAEARALEAKAAKLRSLQQRQ